MNKVSAMKIIDRILQEDFKYLYRRHNINLHKIHLTLQMDSKTHNLQMNFDFQERWCDLLCFISPTILTPNSDNYWEALKTVNYINWNIKSWGRYYIDTYGDMAYSLRIDYDILEKLPNEYAKEVECTIDYFVDIFVPLLNVGQGNNSFADTKQLIDDMWGGVQ